MLSLRTLISRSRDTIAAASPFSTMARAAAAAATAFALEPLPQPAGTVAMNPYLYLPPAPTRFPLHARLVPRASSSSAAAPTASIPAASAPRLLVIGDIHGCFSELLSLVALSGLDFSRGDSLLAAGDLVAKGPESRKVIQYLMTGGHFAVLGNHDYAVLANALLQGRLDGKLYQSHAEFRQWSPDTVAESDPSSAEYARVFYARLNGHFSVARKGSQHYDIAAQLSDEELEWMATLPVSIDLSSAFAPVGSSSEDDASASSRSSSSPSSWTVVHAGLAPHIPLHSQHPYHCMMMRNVLPPRGEPVSTPKIGAAWAMATAASVAAAGAHASAASSTDASVPPSPSPALAGVIFGHDAARGFQHPLPTRLGLDTGACNGKFLTGLLLPETRLFAVKAEKMYAKPKGEKDRARRPPAEATTESGVPLERVPCEEVANPRAPAEATEVTTTPVPATQALAAAATAVEAVTSGLARL